MTRRTAKCHRNHSIPIFSRVQTFDRIPGTDTRPFETDLGQVAGFEDLGREVRLWWELEAALAIRRCPEKHPWERRVLLADTGETVILSSSYEQVCISGRETLQKHLEKEEESWEKLRELYRWQFPP